MKKRHITVVYLIHLPLVTLVNGVKHKITHFSHQLLISDPSHSRTVMEPQEAGDYRWFCSEGLQWLSLFSKEPVLACNPGLTETLCVNLQL